MTSQSLYHFTCDHGRKGLGRRGVLRPNPHIADALIWLTSDRDADREGLGLTSTMLACDRMAYLYETVGRNDAEPWLTSPYRATMDPRLVADLESFGRPDTWWVTRSPVRVRLRAVCGARPRRRI